MIPSAITYISCHASAIMLSFIVKQVDNNNVNPFSTVKTHFNNNDRKHTESILPPPNLSLTMNCGERLINITYSS